MTQVCKKHNIPFFITGFCFSWAPIFPDARKGKLQSNLKKHKQNPVISDLNMIEWVKLSPSSLFSWVFSPGWWGHLSIGWGKGEESVTGISQAVAPIWSPSMPPPWHPLGRAPPRSILWLLGSWAVSCKQGHIHSVFSHLGQDSKIFWISPGSRMWIHLHIVMSVMKGKVG